VSEFHLGLAHKTEINGVHLNLRNIADVEKALAEMDDLSDRFLIEEMVTEVIAELLVGVTRDETELWAMTLGAGGVMAELLADTATLVLPITPDGIRGALANLKISKLLEGYRGKPKADIDTIVNTLMKLSAYVFENKENLTEFDINPLAVGTDFAMVLDALIINSKPEENQ